MKHWRKIWLGILLCVVAAAGLMPGALTTAAAVDYSLWVGGDRVTSDNLSGDGWTYTPASNTLALSGFSYTGKGSSYQTSGERYWSAIQYNDGRNELTITLEGSSQINIQPANEQTSDRLCGMFSMGPVKIQGSGTLNIQFAGATANSNTGMNIASTLTVQSGTVKATGGTANSGRSVGIEASAVTVNGGTVTAVGGISGQSYGISTGRAPVTINGGTVTATGGTSGHSYGIYGNVTVGENARLDASGHTKAVDGTVANSIAGTGWGSQDTTFEGTGIALNTSGQTYNYRLIRFPGVAYYPLYVGGARVTSENLSGTGWSFTPKTDSTRNTLSLNGFSYSGIGESYNTSDGPYQAAILYTSYSDPLAITLAGTNGITATGTSRPRGIMSFNDIMIEGSGSLNISVDSTASSGKVGMDVLSLTVSGGTVTAAGGDTTDGSSTGISAITVTVDGGTVEATGGNRGISASGAVAVTGGAVTAAGGSIGIASGEAVTIGEGGQLTASGSSKAIDGTVKNAVGGGGYSNTQGTADETIISVNTSGQTLDYKYVIFPKVISCSLWVGNTEVTSENLSGSGWSYNPDNKTLTLNNAAIPAAVHDLHVYEGPDRGKANIFSLNDLTIKLQGTNTLSGTADVGIYVFGNLTIQGSGSLAVQNATDCAIRTGGGGDEEHWGDLTIAGGTIQASGSAYGIFAYEDMTVSGGNVSVSSAGDAIYSRFGSIAFNGGTVTAETQNGHAVWTLNANNRAITIDQDLMITKPKNGSVCSVDDGVNSYWCIADAGQNEAASVKIEPPPEYSITVSGKVSGGTVDVPGRVKAGTTVQLKVAEGSAQALKWEVTDSDEEPVQVSDTDTFIMPAADVTVFAWFTRPTVTIEFGENHTDFAAFYRQKTGWGGTGSRVTFSIDAGQTVGDARALIMDTENPHEGEMWLTDEKRHDGDEILDINKPYTLKAITSYTDRTEMNSEVSQVPKGDFTLYAPWLKPAGDVSITVSSLNGGTTVGTQGSGALLRTDPTVTATVTGNAVQSTASGCNWYKDENFNEWFSGTVEYGQAQYAQVRLETNLGYWFADIENSVKATRGTIQKKDFNASVPAYLTVYVVLPPIYSVTVTNDGNGTGSALPESGETGTEVTLTASPAKGYQFKEWQAVSGSVTITGNKFTIGTENVRIKAVFEKEAAVVTTAPKDKKLTYTGQAQELVAAGKASGGTMQYALGTDEKTAPTTGWGTEIPAGTDAKAYYVWYKVKGDKDHSDSQAGCVTATIARASIAEAVVTLDGISLDYTGSEQSVAVTGVKLGEKTLAAGTDYEVSGTTGTDKGSYTVTVTGRGNYKDSATAHWSIGLVVPVISTVPTASGITYGQALKDSILSGGEAKAGEADVSGTFAWKNPDLAPAVSDSETTEYAVTFTPGNPEIYAAVECRVRLKVNKANAVPANVTANNRTSDGTKQPLVNVDNSTLVGGTMQYALGTDSTTAPAETAYTAAIPAASGAGTWYVWYMAKGDENHLDSEAACVTVVIAGEACTITFDANGGRGKMKPVTVEKGSEYTLPKCKFKAPSNRKFKTWDQGKPGKKITVTGDIVIKAKWTVSKPKQGLLLPPQLTPSGNTKLEAKWDKMNGAEGYDVYLAPCGNDQEAKLYKSIDKAKTLKCSITGLTYQTAYRVYVLGWIKDDDGKKVYLNSPTEQAHAIAGGSDGSKTTPKKVAVDPSNISVEAGKNQNVKSTVTGIDPNLEIFVHSNITMRWYSSDTSVAKVDDNGKIKGVKEGTCTVWAVAINGLRAKVSVEVTAKGSEPGKKDIGKAKVSRIKDQTYTGKEITPKLTVKYKGKKLKEGTDYTVKWENNQKIGTATATVKGKGSYKGSQNVTFKIRPKGVNLAELKAGKKELAVKWEKGSKIDGYEIEYSRKEDFSESEKATVNDPDKTSKKIKDLKKGKTYYVRIRTYKNAGGKTYYSKWSEAMKAKLKK